MKASVVVISVEKTCENNEIESLFHHQFFYLVKTLVLSFEIILCITHFVSLAFRTTPPLPEKQENVSAIQRHIVLETSPTFQSWVCNCN